MISKEWEKKKRVFEKSRPVKMNYFTIKEADHFFGHDIMGAINKDLDYIPVNSADSLPFHCELNLNQIDYETGICFRSVCTRINNGNIYKFEHDGVPDTMLDYYKKRSLIMYRIVYPRGLTIEDMRQ